MSGSIPRGALDLFAGFDDYMEEKEPGWKAGQKARREERERRRKERCSALLVEFGSEDAIFAETVRETLLMEALAPMEDENSIWGYSGFDGNTPSPEMWAALARAFPLPTSLQEAWLEYQEWETLVSNRITFCPDYSPGAWVDVRQQAVARLLDGLRDPTIDGIRARLAWLSYLNETESSRDVRYDKTLAQTLVADFEAIARAIAC